MDDNYSYPGRNTLSQKIIRSVAVEQRVINQARNLAGKLNKEIEKGNDNTAFLIALSLAALKDFLDIILTVSLIGLIPGVNFFLGLFLTSFLFFFMLSKGWFLKLRLKIWF